MYESPEIEDERGHKGLFAGKGGIIVCFSPKVGSRKDSQTSRLCISVSHSQIRAERSSVPQTIHDHAEIFHQEMFTLLFCTRREERSWAGMRRYG